MRAHPGRPQGRQGGGGGRTPVEVRDSLHSTAYARVIDLLGEGEIYGRCMAWTTRCATST